jgi:hypothetical protein
MVSIFKEQQAFILARAYLNEFSKLDVRHFHISSVKKTKYWKAFTKTVEFFGDEPEWDASKFVKVLFYAFGKIYPFQMATKKSWETYVDYYNRGEIDIETNIAKSLLNSHQFIKRWEEKNNKKFFSYDNTSLFRNISPYYLSISQQFYDVYCLLPEIDKKRIIDKNDLETKRIMVNIHKKIYEKMKEVLGNDFRRNI